MAANRRADPGLAHSPADHPIHIGPRHRSIRELAITATDAAKERRLLVACVASGAQVLIQVSLEIVVDGHVVTLAAFLVQPDARALALRIVVLDAQPHRGPDAGEAIGQERDQRAVPQSDDGADVDTVEELASFFRGKNRRLTAGHDVFRASHRRRRIHGEEAADHQPVEEHPDRRQVLFHGGRGERSLQALDVGHDVERLDVPQPLGRDPRLAARGVVPREEPRDRPKVRRPGVRIANGGREELQVTFDEAIAAGDHESRDARDLTRGDLPRGRPVDIGTADQGVLGAVLDHGVKSIITFFMLLYMIARSGLFATLALLVCELKGTPILPLYRIFPIMSTVCFRCAMHPDCMTELQNLAARGLRYEASLGRTLARIDDLFLEIADDSNRSAQENWNLMPTAVPGAHADLDLRCIDPDDGRITVIARVVDDGLYILSADIGTRRGRRDATDRAALRGRNLTWAALE